MNSKNPTSGKKLVLKIIKKIIIPILCSIILPLILIFLFLNLSGLSPLLKELVQTSEEFDQQKTDAVQQVRTKPTGPVQESRHIGVSREQCVQDAWRTRPGQQ